MFGTLFIVFEIPEKNVSYDQVKEDQRFEHVKNDLKRNSDSFQVKSKLILHSTLNGWVKTPGGGYKSVSYRDQIDPLALSLIREVEDKNRFLLDKVEMMFTNFPVVKSADDGGIWGVAIWQDVDPKIDYVSVNVRGLTNAYRISTTADGERKFNYRNLQLNFWRPGDTIRQQEDKIKYGIPLVDDSVRQVEICERYRLPGPLIRGYLVSESASQNVLIAEIDAGIQLSDFRSTITPTLDEGNVPDKLKKAFHNAGVEIPDGTNVGQLVAGKNWALEAQMNGQPHKFLLVVEPQYWEPDFDGIRFIKSLDHLWKYR